MLKRVILSILIFLLAINLIACSKNEAVNYEDIKKRGYLVMGLDDTFAPMGFRDEGGELVGFDVDLAKEVFKLLDLDVEFQTIDWSMKEKELENGNIDLIWNGYSITNERKEKVLFSQAYLENRQIIIVLGDSTIESKNDLKGKRLAVQNGSSSLEALRKEEELVKELDGGEAILFDTNHEALLDLEAGRSDAVVSDEVLARYYINKNESQDYKVLADDFGKEEYGIGFRKSDKDLCKDVNWALEELKSNGKYDQIYKKWFK